MYILDSQSKCVCILNKFQNMYVNFGWPIVLSQCYVIVICRPTIIICIIILIVTVLQQLVRRSAHKVH